MKKVKKMSSDELNEYSVELMLDIMYSTREILRLQENVKKLSHQVELVDAELERKEAGAGNHVTNQ